MTGLINIPLQRQYWLRPVNLFVAGYLLIALFSFGHYILPGSVNLILGLLALPFSWKPDPSKKGSYRYGWLTLALMVLCFIMPVKTLLYFSIGFALLYFTESYYGKTSLPAILLIIFASPVFQYIGDVFSFPIRLQLTKSAGFLFNLLAPGVEVRGNMIINKGNEFSVDPACMGLTMITASLLSGIMLLGFYQEKHKRKPGTIAILLYLGIILLLNVIANLSRIVLLVQFNIQPGTLSHEIAGLGCFLVYVLMPGVAWASLLIRRSPLMQTHNRLPAVSS